MHKLCSIKMTKLTDILRETIPLQEHTWKWMFENEDGHLPTTEHLDQIFPLDSKASNYLWKFENEIKLNTFAPETKRYFKDFEKFSFGDNMDKEVKKWLFNRQVKFDNIVYMTFQPTVAFAMTWKMAIHYSANLFFGHDTTIWDRTLNWALYYDHNDVFYFAKNRFYDGQEEKLKLDRLIKEITVHNNT